MSTTRTAKDIKRNEAIVMSVMWAFLVALAAGVALLAWSLLGRGDGGRARSILAERVRFRGTSGWA